MCSWGRAELCSVPGPLCVGVLAVPLKAALEKSLSRRSLQNMSFALISVEGEASLWSGCSLALLAGSCHDSSSRELGGQGPV